MRGRRFGDARRLVRGAGGLGKWLGMGADFGDAQRSTANSTDRCNSMIASDLRSVENEAMTPDLKRNTEIESLEIR